ncbi:MAG: cold-shock protein [Cytophagales bacterium]
MGRKNHNAFIKKLKAEKKKKKKAEKRQEKEERKNEETSGELKDMIAYIDDDGNLSETPPDDSDIPKNIQKDLEDNETQDNDEKQ